MIRSTLRVRILCLAACLAPFTALLAGPDVDIRSLEVEFGRDIQPIFRAHCSPCHTGDQSSGGLSLQSFESLAKGGVSGPAVAPGSPNRSVLIQRILGHGDLPRMPMGFKPLSDHDVSLLTDWVAQGAKPPTGKPRSVHWAFVAPARPKVPVVDPWVANPIDSFILDRMRRQGLRPSPAADRTTLIRRVSFDLIGLPPTPAEVEQFVTDRSPNAYEKVVDRLLSSPHYGERMALPWLDAARYADSNGFQQDGDTFQWVWRDWVVRSMNANMPFDQFTIEQLAGDLLLTPTRDQLVATAFNRNHMLNGEGGAIPEEQRFVNLFDRVDTTSSTWLGLTMGCARCHDHKYDPLTQVDYYSMMAFFNKVPETGVPSGSGQYRIAEPWVYAGSINEMHVLSRANRLADRANDAIAAYLAGSEFGHEFDVWRRKVVDDLNSTTITIRPWREVGTHVGTSFDDAFDRNFGPETGRIEKGTERADLEDGKIHPLNGDNTAIYFQRAITVDRNAAYLLSLGSDDGIRVWLNGKEVFSRKITRGVAPDSDRAVVELIKGENSILVKVVNGGGIGGFYFRGFLGGVDEKTADGIRSGSIAEDRLKAVFADSTPSAKLRELQAAAEKANEDLAAVRSRTPRVMVMSDAKPRRTFVLNRGDYENPAEEVKSNTPKSLPGATARPDRLGLARWIVSANNPLTSRVQANRAWQLFFGRGLVRTEENFGLKGEPPTHPELLDWLAVELRESGWNVKRLHKSIVMSNTYRQASRLTDELRKKDPANLLFARSPRYRLPSMLLRDAALASSGLLNPTFGGKPVYPYQPKGIWDGLSITLERDFTYPQSKGSDNYRRSLYTFWRRTAAPGNMFDSSSRQVCTVKFTVTSTPLHALVMLNDVTWVEAGRALADRVSGAPTDLLRIEGAFRRICSRRPSASEATVLLRSLERARAAFRKNPALATEYLGQGEWNPSAAVRKNPIDRAALAAVCVSIYNLDEAVTRP